MYVVDEKQSASFAQPGGGSNRAVHLWDVPVKCLPGSKHRKVKRHKRCFHVCKSGMSWSRVSRCSKLTEAYLIIHSWILFLCICIRVPVATIRVAMLRPGDRQVVTDGLPEGHQGVVWIRSVLSCPVCFQPPIEYADFYLIIYPWIVSYQLRYKNKIPIRICSRHDGNLHQTAKPDL